MKRLLSVLLLSFLSYGAMAQANSLVVKNNTNCWVYYIIHGGPGCDVSYISSVISLPPGGTVTYSGTASIPGFPPGPFFINAAGVYYKPTTCFPTSLWRVGEPCTGMLPSWNYTVYNTSCTVCGNITAAWTPAMGGLAKLTFY